MKLSLLFLPLLAFTTGRAAFDPAVVPADARWLVYLDLDTLRESALGRELTSMFEDSSFAKNESGLRVNLQKLLATAGSATAYGVNFSKDPKAIDGTLVLQGTPDLRTIAEGYIAQLTVSQPDGIKELVGMPFESYELKGGVTIAFPPEPVILLSKSKEQLVNARNVLSGGAASLAKKPSRLSELLPNLSRSFLTAATIVPSSEGLFDEDGPQARILRMASSGSFSLGEDNGMSGARLKLVSSSDAMADKLTKILQGMAALVALAETDDQHLNTFLKSVTVQRADNTVQLALSYPTARLVELVKGLQDKNDHGTQAPQAPRPPKKNAAMDFPAAEAGTIVESWTSEPTPEVSTHAIDTVSLKQGAVVTINTVQEKDDISQIDYVDFAAVGASASPLRYEAEYMRLNGYRPGPSPLASGGQVVVLTDKRGSASFQFQGATGSYRVTIGYIARAARGARHALSVKLPEALAAPAKDI